MQRFTLNAPLIWSLAFIGATVLSICFMLPPLFRAATVPAIEDVEVENEFARMLERHEEDLATYVKRFDGRSIFYQPSPPPRPVVRRTPPPSPERRDPPKPTTPRDPEPPRRPAYSGPAVVGAAVNQAWFKGEIRVPLGKTVDGLTLVAINTPWDVTVEHRNWEYTLPLFKKANLFGEPEPENNGATGGAPGLSGLIPADDVPPPAPVAPAGDPVAERPATDAPASENSALSDGRRPGARASARPTPSAPETMDPNDPEFNPQSARAAERRANAAKQSDPEE